MDRRHKPRVLTAISSIKELIDNNQLNGDNITGLAATFGSGRNALQQAFKEIHGMGIRDYRLKQRMVLGRQMLDEGKDIKEISIILHYSKPRAFSAAFKKYYGVNPTELSGMVQTLTK